MRGEEKHTEASGSRRTPREEDDGCVGDVREGAQDTNQRAVARSSRHQLQATLEAF